MNAKSKISMWQLLNQTFARFRTNGDLHVPFVVSRSTHFSIKQNKQTVEFIVASMVTVFAMLAAPSAIAVPDVSLLNYAGADRQQRLVAAAKAEGTLTLYTTIAEKDLVVLIGPFEKKYDIKVKVWRAGTDKVLQRTLTEAQAKRYEVDAVHFGAPEMDILRREKLLRPVLSPHFKQLIASAVPTHREWTATLLSVWVQAYNTNVIKKSDLPKTYFDFLDPKWKGKLGIEVKNEDWFSSVATELGGEKGVNFFRELVAKNGISTRQGHTLLNNMVVSGEVPLALTVYNYMPEASKKKGAPIDWFVIEPAIARANAIGIARNAPHPNAAMLFFDFMLSDAQALMQSIDYVPTSAGVDHPFGKMRIVMVDPASPSELVEKWAKLFQEIVVKRTGAQ